MKILVMGLSGSGKTFLSKLLQKELERRWIKMLNEEILISPIITEKSSMLQESNKYVFKVHKNSNKSQIKNAVEEVFDVTVESVNVIKVKGKNKTYGRNRVLTPAWKKAMVTLKLGDSISLYEGA